MKLTFLILLNFRVVSINDEENANATSSEILEDVLKQLDKLGTDKRNQILKKLKASVAHNKDSEATDQYVSSTSPKSEKVGATTKSTDSETVQDEVEILDLNEPKMGTYKRKRSE